MQIALSPPHHPLMPRIALSIVSLAVGFAVAATIAGLGPLQGVRGSPPDAGTRAVRALPFDAPVPDGEPVFAGTGREMPYLLKWDSSLSSSQAARSMEEVIARRPRWSVTLTREAGGAREATLNRTTSDGMMTHFARLTVAPAAAGSHITFEFIAMTDLGQSRRIP